MENISINLYCINFLLW